MTYPVKAIANYFIRTSKIEKDNSLNLMKLLKLIYLAHGWNLALYSKPLIGETVEAWTYGPVISEIYHTFKHYGISALDDIAKDYNVNDKGQIEVNEYKVKFTIETYALLKKIWEVYKENTGIQLSNWSHKTDGPWFKAWYLEGGHKFKRYPISNDIIKDYFIKLGMANATTI